MQAEDVLACQFGRWQPGLARLAYRSRVLDLPPDFGGWLQQDGVHVPEGSTAVRTRAAAGWSAGQGVTGARAGPQARQAGSGRQPGLERQRGRR